MSGRINFKYPYSEFIIFPFRANSMADLGNKGFFERL